MTTVSKDKAAVLQLHDEVVNAFNTLDIDKLLSLHTENIILMEPGMRAITGKVEVTKFFKKIQQQQIAFKLSYQLFEVEVFGNRAFVCGQVIKQTIRNNRPPEYETGKFISLSQKQYDGKWLRTHVIVNSDKINAYNKAPVYKEPVLTEIMFESNN